MTIHEYEKLNPGNYKYEIVGYEYDERTDKFYKIWSIPPLEEFGLGETYTDFNDEIIDPDDEILGYFIEHGIPIPEGL